MLSYRIWESGAPLPATPGIGSYADSAGDELFSPSTSPIPGSEAPARSDESLESRPGLSGRDVLSWINVDMCVERPCAWDISLMITPGRRLSRLYVRKVSVVAGTMNP